MCKHYSKRGRPCHSNNIDLFHLWQGAAYLRYLWHVRHFFQKGVCHSFHGNGERQRERFIALREYQNKIVVYAVLFSEKSMFFLEEHVVQMLQALKGCRIC